MKSLCDPEPESTANCEGAKPEARGRLRGPGPKLLVEVEQGESAEVLLARLERDGFRGEAVKWPAAAAAVPQLAEAGKAGGVSEEGLPDKGPADNSGAAAAAAVDSASGVGDQRLNQSLAAAEGPVSEMPLGRMLFWSFAFWLGALACSSLAVLWLMTRETKAREEQREQKRQEDKGREYLRQLQEEADMREGLPASNGAASRRLSAEKGEDIEADVENLLTIRSMAAKAVEDEKHEQQRTAKLAKAAKDAAVSRRRQLADRRAAKAAEGRRRIQLEVAAEEASQTNLEVEVRDSQRRFWERSEAPGIRDEFLDIQDEDKMVDQAEANSELLQPMEDVGVTLLESERSSGITGIGEAWKRSKVIGSPRINGAAMEVGQAATEDSMARVIRELLAKKDQELAKSATSNQAAQGDNELIPESGGDLREQTEQAEAELKLLQMRTAQLMTELEATRRATGEVLDSMRQPRHDGGPRLQDRTPGQKLHAATLSGDKDLSQAEANAQDPNGGMPAGPASIEERTGGAKLPRKQKVNQLLAGMVAEDGQPVSIEPPAESHVGQKHIMPARQAQVDIRTTALQPSKQDVEQMTAGQFANKSAPDSAGSTSERAGRDTGSLAAGQPEVEDLNSAVKLHEQQVQQMSAGMVAIDIQPEPVEQPFERIGDDMDGQPDSVEPHFEGRKFESGIGAVEAELVMNGATSASAKPPEAANLVSTARSRLRITRAKDWKRGAMSNGNAYSGQVVDRPNSEGTAGSSLFRETASAEDLSLTRQTGVRTAADNIFVNHGGTGEAEDVSQSRQTGDQTAAGETYVNGAEIGHRQREAAQGNAGSLLDDLWAALGSGAERGPGLDNLPHLPNGGYERGPFKQTREAKLQDHHFLIAQCEDVGLPYDKLLDSFRHAATTGPQWADLGSEQMAKPESDLLQKLHMVLDRYTEWKKKRVERFLDEHVENWDYGKDSVSVMDPPEKYKLRLKKPLPGYEEDSELDAEGAPEEPVHDFSNFRAKLLKTYRNGAAQEAAPTAPDRMPAGSSHPEPRSSDTGRAASYLTQAPEVNVSKRASKVQGWGNSKEWAAKIHDEQEGSATFKELAPARGPAKHDSRSTLPPNGSRISGSKRWSPEHQRRYDEEKDPEIKRLIREVGQDLDSWIKPADIRDAWVADRNDMEGYYAWVKRLEVKEQEQRRQERLARKEAQRRAQASGELQELWWLSLSLVWVVGVHSPGTDGAESKGRLYTIKVGHLSGAQRSGADVQESTTKQHIVAFVNQQDAMKMAQVLSRDKDYEGSGITVAATDPKGLNNDTSAEGWGVTAMSKGSLQFNPNQSLQDVENDILESEANRLAYSRGW